MRAPRLYRAACYHWARWCATFTGCADMPDGALLWLVRTRPSAFGGYVGTFALTASDGPTRLIAGAHTFDMSMDRVVTAPEDCKYA